VSQGERLLVKVVCKECGSRVASVFRDEGGTLLIKRRIREKMTTWYIPEEWAGYRRLERRQKRPGMPDLTWVTYEPAEPDKPTPVAGSMVYDTEESATSIEDPRSARRRVAAWVADGMIPADDADSILRFSSVPVQCKRHGFGSLRHLDFVPSLERAEKTGKVMTMSIDLAAERSG